MKLKSTPPKTVSEYILLFPKDIQSRLKTIRAIVKKIVPESDEKLSYGMPYFYFKGRLLYFAGYTNHIGFYPMPSAIKKFQKEISKFKYAKGSIQFPHDQALPVALITKIIKFRANENRSGN